MNFLIIQERGRHEANRNFREALSLQRALIANGHFATVWGLGYALGEESFEEMAQGRDAIILLEQYDQTGWVPDFSWFRGPRVFWTVDSHCNLAEHQAQVKRQNITHLLSSTRGYLDAYEAPHKVWFPNCYDDTLIAPMPEIPNPWPVGFCGNDNGRLQWLDGIGHALGVQVKADVFVIGQAMVRAICGYQIHFNRNIGDDINYRTFETTGCGTLLMTNYTPGLEELFVPGEEVIAYYTYEQLLAGVRYYLDRPDERAAVAAAGYARAKRDHTYRNRAEQLCRILEST